MREILFRGKRIDNGEWEEGSLIVEPHRVRIWKAYDERSSCNHEVDPATIGQYTGEVVYNGRMLYEGDILTINPDTRVESIRCVVWKDGCFQLRGIKRVSANAPLQFYCLQEDRLSELVVLGNIHDNPELLEASNG